MIGKTTKAQPWCTKAASCDDAHALRILAEGQANFFAQDKAGWTAAHYAAKHGCLGALKFLLQKDSRLLTDATACGSCLEATADLPASKLIYELGGHLGF